MDVALVREYQARKAMERVRLVESMGNYLQGLGIDAKVVKETAEEVIGEIITVPVIQIKGQKIDNIHLMYTDYVSCGLMGSISRYQYRIIPVKELPDSAGKTISSKTKTIKDNKVLGLFAGKVADVKWEGRELADRLNNDAEIKNILLHCAGHWGNAEFETSMLSPTLIEILGPRFVETECLQQIETSEGKKGFEDCVFGFKICNRIAGHIRDTINAL